MKRLSLALLPLAGLLLPAAVFAKPVISGVSPTTATANVAVTLSASVQSSVPIQSCNLYVDLADVGPMTVVGGVASRSYTFPSGGSRIAFVFCKDTSAGMAAGANSAIWVEGQIQSQPPLSNPSPNPTPTPTPTPTSTQPPVSVPVSTLRQLIKLECPANATADHPCKAVYYVGADGKRHAYPNSRVFFTWYQNFNGVQTVSQAALNLYPLGRNITYRPAVRMVKFTTLNKVYAVARDGSLRWVKTEDVARALYGADWNTKIDDISDTFFTDYTFGPDIDLAASFNLEAELQSRPTFD